MANNTTSTPVDQIINDYLNRGFGTMTKNDFEVWIFHQLLCGRLHGKTNREISVALRIPDSKVKRLRYEADLKWGNPDDDSSYHDALVAVVKKARLIKEKKQIQFVIEDTALLKYLDARMKCANVSWDKSFNSENISIDFEQYETFCKEVLTKEYKEAIDFLKDKFKYENSIAKLFKDYYNKSRNKIIEELAEGTADIAKKGLETFVKNAPLVLSMLL